MEGCLAWQCEGLKPPPTVLAASQQYRDESDALAEFIAAKCELGRDFKESSAELFRSYNQFCEKNGLGDRDKLGAKTFQQPAHRAWL